MSAPIVPVDLRLKDLHPDAFVHPEDQAALQALRDVPGLDLLVKAITGSTVERSVHMTLSHTAIKVGPAQYRSLHGMVERAATALDVPVPDAYLVNGYTVNAMAFGFNTYTVQLYQGLVDLLDEDELQAVIGHELGHIACEHMLYKSLAWIVTELGAQVMGRLVGAAAGLVSGGLELALYRWSRAAEYSCDRAALLVTRNPRAVASALAKLGGPSRRYASEFDLDAALEQARSFDQQADSVDRLMHTLAQLSQTHPEPILRAAAILDWSESEQYAAIIQGRYPTRSAYRQRLLRPRIEGVAYCSCCDGLVDPLKNRCPTCACHRSPARQVSCPHGHVNDVRWTRCRVCRVPLANDGG